jgi:hypothetical protein
MRGYTNSFEQQKEGACAREGGKATKRRGNSGKLRRLSQGLN